MENVTSSIQIQQQYWMWKGPKQNNFKQYHQNLPL